VVSPLVLIVGRRTEAGKGLRTPGYGSGRFYCDAVVRAGGIPVVLPPSNELIDRIDDVLDRVDGLVLHGGVDINPRRYGATTIDPNVYGVSDELDDVEFAVLTRAIERDLPTLAICRGFQVLNVERGGSLIQHLESDAHRDVFHEVEVSDGSRLAEALGSHRAGRCHSFHHQVVDRLGDGLVITGHADDGIIEAIEVVDRRWVVGVQWHPEDTAADDPEQQALFDRFVRECVRRGPGTGA
jgi:gamma-glutamyl-gamma-aminobutyrate hydrolase PuuD